MHRLRNLPMLVGLAPVSAYRTLDLPAVEKLTDAGIRIALRAVRPASAAGDRDELARLGPDRKPDRARAEARR